MNYLIIGGNACGMSAAVKLKRNDSKASIIVLEKGNLISFGACGLPYYIADRFSDKNTMIARNIEDFKKLDIDVKLFHEAYSMNAEKKEVYIKNTETNENLTFTYDKLLISTGASPFKPKINGIELENVHTLTKMEDGIAIKEKLKSVKNVIIVGGGFIGLETAEAMTSLGINTTLIERSDRMCEKVFDKEITDILEKKIEECELALKVGEEVIEILGDNGKVTKVVTNKAQYDADLVIIAIGFTPNTEFCKSTGIKMLPNGAIIIDENCKTSIDDIYSGGDCATVKNAVHGGDSYIPLATNANKLGRLIGNTFAGIKSPFQGTLGTSAIRYMDFELACTGINENEAKRLNIEYSTNFIKEYNKTAYTPKGLGYIYIKLVYNKKTRVLLGAQTCGAKGAVLRIDALAVVVFSKMTVDTLGMLDFVYSPPFSGTWDIMNIAGNTSK